MPAVHDSDYRSSLRARVDKLTPESARQWGTMTVDQMLWHVNAALCLGLGKLRAERFKAPLPLAILRPLALYMPWPKGKAQAVPETVGSGHYDLDAERRRFHALVEEFAAKPEHFNWLDHPMLGRLSGPDWSRLQAKHVDYHLRQFGA